MYQLLNRIWRRFILYFTIKKIEVQQEVNQSNSAVSILPTAETALVPAIQNQQEQAWFSRKNNLVQEFAFNPKPVYGSDLTRRFDKFGQLIEPEPIYYLDGYGNRVDKEGQPYIDGEADEQEELLHDDVSFLQDNKKAYKPNTIYYGSKQ